METITTTVHAYQFDVSKQADRAGYDALRDKLTAMGLRCFDTYAPESYDKNYAKHQEAIADVAGKSVALETAFLFDNQWNTAPIPGVSDSGLRLMDWAETIFRNRSIKSGYWLEQTDAMLAIRRDTLKCGYCGKQEPATSGLKFCPHCIDSEYLKAGDLYLTRLVPVNTTGPGQKFAPLTDAERADLMPRYTEAQIHGSTVRGKARLAKKRAAVIEDCSTTIERALAERDGFLWCMDRGVNTDNLIYYGHTGRFSFGWRSPIGADVLPGLQAALTEFPFSYDIVTGHGKVAGPVSSSGYVVKNTETGLYVARLGRPGSYTNKLEHARRFGTEEEANGARCEGNEVTVPVEAVLAPTGTTS